MGSGTIPPEGRGEDGKFAKGNPGGPGRRPGRSPLHKAVSNEKAEELWAARVVIAESDPDPARRDAAAEFVLKFKNGTPAASVPDCPPLNWPDVMTVADLAAASGAVLTAHRCGEIDGAALSFLVDLIARLARVYETVEMAPRLARLEEHFAAQAAAQGANQ